MRNHKGTMLGAMVIIIGLSAASADAQIIYGRPTSGHLQLVYSNWSLEDEYGKVDVSQLMIPATGFIPLQENLELRFSAADASTTVGVDNADYSLSGLTDLRLQVNQSLSDDKLLLSLGINLPTGKKKLSQDEDRLIMEFLTQNYLTFPLRRYGEGFGVNGLVGAAAVSGNIRYGGTLMYQINGAYQAYQEQGDYKPGNQFRASLGADTRSDAWRWAADVAFSVYSTDKIDAQQVYKQGSHLDLHLGSGYDAEKTKINVDFRYLIRSRNTHYDSTGAVFDQLKVYGNEFYFGSRVAYAPSKAWFVAPLADLRLIAGNEYEFGGSYTVGIGVESGRTFGEGFDFAAGFKYYTGSADDGNIDLAGWQLTAGLTAAF